MHVVIAHGASGSAASMRPWVDGLATHGVTATAIDLPVRRAEAAVASFRAAAAAAAPDRADEGLVIGGQSYGGRVASLLAAEEAADGLDLRGLVLLCYPLHRPGAPDGETRVTHWPRLRLPTLLLSGEADPFARIDLLRAAVREALPEAELVTYPKLGHSLAPVREDAVGRIARFVARLDASPPGGP